MIRQLAGILVHKDADEIVISCGGVGYALCMPSHARLPSIGERITVWTHLRVREDALDLFGFSTRDELSLFLSMQKIRRFPAKTAMAVISHCGVEGFRQAVATGDIEALTRIPGIGKKSAQQVLLEMRGQIDLGSLSADVGTAGLDDATLALVQLGFSETESKTRIDKIRASNPAIKDTAEIVKIALRR